MKLGFFVTNQYLPGESFPQKIQESVEQVRAAREAGFDMICTGQHYLASPYQMSSSFPLLARLAAEAGDMEVAATVILVPLHNPVELAESVATMDAICGGRFIFGVGLGYRDEEYTSFGVQRAERVARLREALEVMKLLWTQEEVEFNGQFYTVPRVAPSTKPVQQPHPPIWVAANNDVAIRRAARWGYPWLVNPHATVQMVADQWQGLPGGPGAGRPAHARVPAHDAGTLRGPGPGNGLRGERTLAGPQVRRLRRLGPGQGLAGGGKLFHTLPGPGPRPVPAGFARRRGVGDSALRKGTGCQLPDFQDAMARHVSGSHAAAD